MDTIKKTQPVKMGLLLLGSFCIAYFIASFLHEASHAGAAYFTGGNVGRMVIHPFNWSYIRAFSPNHPIFFLAAGAIGSSLISLPVYILLIRWPKPLLLPLVLVGPVTLIYNGEYYIVDALQGSGGDACGLIRLGVPIPVIFFAGAVLLIMGLTLSIHLIRTIGLTNDTFRTRLIVLFIGIFPYSAAMLIWNWIYYRKEFGLWLTFCCSSAAIVFFIAVISRFFRTKKQISFSPGWPTAVGVDLFAVGLLIALLIMSSSAKTTFASNFKLSSTRPEGFPGVLIPHPEAMNTSYMITPSINLEQAYFLIYDLPENTAPDEVLEYLTNLYKEHGYVQLKYSLYDPNELIDSFKEETAKIGIKTTLTKQYRQVWIKLIPDVSPSTFFMAYTWSGDNFKNAFATMHVTKWKADEIFEYAEIHPDAFDPNQLEQLKATAAPPGENQPESLQP